MKIEIEKEKKKYKHVRKPHVPREKQEVICNLSNIMVAKGVTGYRMSLDLNIPNAYIYQAMLKTSYLPGIEIALLIANYLETPVEDIWEII